MEVPSKAIHYSWNTPYLDSWKVMPHESLVLWFHGPWNTLRRVHGKFNSLKVFFHGFMAHEILCYKFSWKIQGPWISGHTKFMSHEIKSYPFIEIHARNKGMKFNFNLSSSGQIHSCLWSNKSRWSKILPQLKMATKSQTFWRQFRWFLAAIL